MSTESKEIRIDLDPALVIAELRHRAGNRFAVLQAVVSQTFRTARTLPEAKRTLELRIHALRLVEDVAPSIEGADIDLNSLLTDLSRSYLGSESHRLRVWGPPVALSARSGLALILALHELATNAVKYGALSNGNGTVDVHWSFDVNRTSGRLNLLWRETGGPPVCSPTRKGFGTLLIERVMTAEPDGSASVSFFRDGVQWILRSC